MGKYGDVLNKLDDGLYVKVQPGTPVRLRLLADPRISQQPFTDKQTGEVTISTRFCWPVWDYAQQRVRILDQGKSVFKPIAAAAESWGDTMPSLFDIEIRRTGVGKNGSEYTVVALQLMGTMPDMNSMEVPDGFMQRLKGTPMSQILQGEKPEYIGAAQPSVDPMGLNAPRPTHTVAPELHAVPDPEPDVIPTADDVNRFNVDDIPF